MRYISTYVSVLEKKYQLTFQLLSFDDGFNMDFPLMIFAICQFIDNLLILTFIVCTIVFSKKN